MEGVPKQVRLEVTKRFEEDDGKRGGKENYFDLIHYRKIVTDNWELLSEIFAYGKKGVGKDKGTLWMEELNEKRRCVAHSSSGVSLSIEDLNQVQEYDDWLRRKLLTAMRPLPQMNQSSLKILPALNFNFSPRLSHKSGTPHPASGHLLPIRCGEGIILRDGCQVNKSLTDGVC